MRRSRPTAGVHIHWSEERSGWFTTSRATPLTSAGAEKRSIDLLSPCEPILSKFQRFSVTLLLLSMTFNVPSYRCDLETERFFASSTIVRGSCGRARVVRIRIARPENTAHTLLILQCLHK